jgi:hypothetical protein
MITRPTLDLFKRIALAVLLATATGSASADMVILKSGEMYQTPKAWKENGVVKYYRNGQVVSVDASDVERLIYSSSPSESQAPSVGQPTAGPQMPSAGDSAKRPPRAPLPTGSDAGYLGLTWGLSPSQIDGLVFVETDPAYGGIKQYTRQSQKKRFGRAQVDNIFYGFWQEGLYTILVEVSNFMDFMDLKAEAFRRFGPSTPQSEQMEIYRWRSEGADRQLAYDHSADSGYLWMRSQSMHRKVKALYPD